MTSSYPSGAVAIIGASVNFPGAPDLDAFKTLLFEGREAMAPVEEKHLVNSHHASLHGRDDYVRMCSAMADIEYLDAGFFGLSPREALLLDPQQRHLLQCAWQAFEHAGVVPGDSSTSRTGVFTSVSHSSYLSHYLMPQVVAGELDVVEVALANDKDFAPARIAHRFDLRGPTVAIQTACSSSLVALHMACRSIVDGESDLALVAASTITVPHGFGYIFTEKGMVSRDGRCRPFAEQADGTIFASGAGAVLLRRLEDAIDGHDSIMGVIRGSAINNDGANRVGFTAPSPDGQCAIVAEAMTVAGVSAADIGYVEAHGTATPLGDPIEFAALTEAFLADGSRPHGKVPVGAVKANLGHLDNAAGLAGLIKTLIALDSQCLPRTPHADRPNPELALDQSPFRLLPINEAWKRRDAPRIAGVSSFGMGGSNAHVVLQEGPETATHENTRSCELFVVSGRDDEDAARRTEQLAQRLVGMPDTDFAAVAQTLRHGRTTFGARRSLTASTLKEAAEALQEGRFMGATGSPSKPLIFVLPGQGSQYAGLGRELGQQEPTFAEHRERLRRKIVAQGGPDIDATNLSDKDVQSTALAQPILFVNGVALGYCLAEWGIRADGFIGHSVGEVAVACLTGALSEADACRLITARAKAMADAPAGGMLLLNAAAPTVDALIASAIGKKGEQVLSIAAQNAPQATVAGGDAAAVAALKLEAEAAGIEATPLRTSHAFHTSLMKSAAGKLANALHGLEFKEPEGRVFSTLTGGIPAPEEFASPDYWVRQILAPVRFSDALAAVMADEAPLFLELGPPGGLAASLQQIAPSDPPPSIPLLPHHRAAAAGDNGQRTLLDGIGRLWLSGHNIDWHAFDRGFPRVNTARLPGYPFKRERHWPEGEPTSVVSQATEQPHAPTLLPRRARPDTAPPYEPPKTRKEKQLASLWEEFLLIAPIGMLDNFVNLGGTSITALQLVQKAATEGLKLSVRDVFEQENLAQLARIATPTHCPDKASDQSPDKSAVEREFDLESLNTIHAQLNGL